MVNANSPDGGSGGDPPRSGDSLRDESLVAETIAHAVRSLVYLFVTIIRLLVDVAGASLSGARQEMRDGWARGHTSVHSSQLNRNVIDWTSIAHNVYHRPPDLPDCCYLILEGYEIGIFPSWFVGLKCSCSS